VIWIGLDDTDELGSKGTGHLARELAAWLSESLPLFGVTRHQLLQDPRVPMTAKNSAAAIHLPLDESIDLHSLAEELVGRVRAAAAPGSDPGLCLGQRVSPEVVAFGRRAKSELVSKDEALTIAGEAGLVLHGLGGDDSGVIGALAAVGLAASGADGRFNLCGRLRELQGLQPVSAVLAAGATHVQAVGGGEVQEGLIDTGGKLRPSLVGGQPVLWVQRDDGHWKAVRRD